MNKAQWEKIERITKVREKKHTGELMQEFYDSIQHLCMGYYEWKVLRDIEIGLGIYKKPVKHKT
jgi:hypothetical protein